MQPILAIGEGAATLALGEAGSPRDFEVQVGRGRLMHKFEIILY